MLLRKLEVYGFKSFADRCEIEFGPGVTAIVGPNGSGKSNVSDAIRWALGEQSIRTLRGTKTEDVIFAGSSKRRPLGAAEVSLVFDNSDGLLPLEFSEITLTRRAFRTGESEYYINKTQCRLKDIHDLLADTGLGRDSLTVIGQNKIDELLNAKPEERRVMFEEAAGVTKYKYRKREALRKLEDTEQNLTRVRDLTGEIENQLGPLSESAARTAEYNELHDELVSCQVTLLLDKLEHAEKMVESAKLEETALTEAELAASTRLSLLETEREKQTHELSRLDLAVNDTVLALNQSDTDIERIDGRMALIQEKIAQGKRDAQRLESELESIVCEQAQAGEKIVELDRLLAQKQGEELSASEALLALQAQDKAITDRILSTETAIHSGNEHSFGHMQELVTERNTLRIAERDLETNKHRIATLDKEQERFLAEIAAVREQFSAVDSETGEAKQRLATVAAEMEKAQREMAAARQTLSELTEREKRLAVQMETIASRRQVLVAMEEDNEGYSRAAKSVLKSAAPWRKGVCGAVGQLITVGDEYLTAVEIALGGSLQHVVTLTDETAKQAIAFLKEQKLGRTTFLPLNTLRAQKPRDNELAAAKTAGAVGIAADLVACDPQYKPVIDYLLGRTIVVRDIDSALRIAKQYAQSVRLVTLDGELISPGGSITGGSVARRDASILGRQNEIAALTAKLTGYQSELTELQHSLKAQLAKLQEHEKYQEALSAEKYNLDLKLSELSLRGEKLGNDATRMQFSLKTIQAERSDAEAENERLLQKIEFSRKQIASMESQDIHYKQNLDTLKAALKADKAQKDALSAALTQAHIKLSGIRQELRSLAADREKLIADSRLKDAQLARVREEQNAVAETVRNLDAQLADEAENRRQAIIAKENLEQTRQKLYDEKLSLMADVQKTDREAKDLRRKVQNMQARLHEMQLTVAKYDYEITYSLEQLRDRYELTRDQAGERRRPEPAAELHKRIYGLESRINQLGPVNPAAIDEYTRLNERFTFLNTQLTDLISAKEYLTTIIADIDQTMSKQFKSAFLVINEYFQDTFVKLFGGGQASLKLMDPENLLESGIEIFVQPPGKKQQNLALLSGGERALTVIALLFAFLTYRPTPFVVVDEIDAALDEANVQRFSEFLADFAQSTQFIVVTHRKGTMEAADVMIGVTMEESGVSRLLSVKLMDKAG